MTQDEFVDAVKIQVHDSAIRSALAALSEGASGRRPSTRSLALAEWFRSVGPEDRDRIHELVAVAVHAAVFQFLCLLDGVCVVDDGGVTRLELTAIAGGNRTALNDGSGEMLHDIYQSATYAEVFGETSAWGRSRAT